MSTRNPIEHKRYEGNRDSQSMVFRSSRGIDFPMVDLAGIVYYPRYWDLAHVFFEEIWEPLCGISYPAVLKEKRLALPLVHSEATFHKPMIYGDVAHCEISIIKMGKTSISWRFRIHNQSNELCWSAIQTTVCTSMDSIGEKLEIPTWVREGLDRILE